MHLHSPLLALVLPLACGSCAAPPPEPGRANPPTPVADAPQSIPAEFILSTNEPFWQARVQGDTVLLTGVQGQRRLAVDRNEALFDGRSVTAHDAAGTLELRVTERLCLDSMSGAQFEYTGRLELEGSAPVEGCGGRVGKKD
ncbi:MAG: hypothetical protein EOO80_21215 [Oxalobacteraceae bacterium]|nr:MAG: hypothetical protein EOO80_21215 [Oxalobacteraceae bacterium]